MATEEKKRRISGADFWALYDLLKKLEDAQDVHKEWLRDKAKAEGCYSDQIQRPETGLIVDDKGVKSRCSAEFIAEARVQLKMLREPINALRAEREKIARKYRIWPDLIDEATGEIHDEGIERVEIPTDAPKEEPKKEEKKKDK